MAQDYAKSRKAGNASRGRKAVHSATRVQETSDGHWSWFLSGLMTGLFAAFILYLGFVRPSDSAPAATTTASGETPGSAEDSRADFDFYEYLTEAEVKVDVVPVAERALPEEDTRRYMLQAGSFSTRQDAETQRANVMLLNFDANVVPAIVNGQTRFRVQLGPFTGRQSLDNARDTLAENNIETATLVMR